MTACQNHLVAPARSSTHQLCIERLWRTLTHSAQLEGLIVGQRTRRVRYWLDKPFHRTAGLVTLRESSVNAAEHQYPAQPNTRVKYYFPATPVTGFLNLFAYNGNLEVN